MHRINLQRYVPPVHRVQLHYTLPRRRRRPDPQPAARNAGGRGAAGLHFGAARALGLSYRHVWGALKRWEDQLGGELILGQGPVGAAQRVRHQAAVGRAPGPGPPGPQIAALHADLERAFAVAFDDSTHVLTMYASHDDALGALRAHAATPGEGGALHLDIRFTGSVDAIRALNEGRCTLAGFHTLEDSPPRFAGGTHLPPAAATGTAQDHRLCPAHPGLIVARGNPLGLHTLADVARTGARFVNRPLGTGTRVLLDTDLLALFPSRTRTTTWSA
jgi:putative molybdopterin biosynthesis protein